MLRRNLLLIYSILFPLCASADLNLVKVIALFRHGMRAPIHPLPADPYSETDTEHWPDGYEALVQRGKWQMYILGQRFRERYGNLLLPNNTSYTNDVKLVTTSVDRCYNSAALMLAGFYPPNKYQEWNEDLSWQPVPVRYGSPDKIHIIGKKHLCPVYNADLEKAMKDFEANTPEVGYLREYLSNVSDSIKTDTLFDLFKVGDYFVTKRALEAPVPDWANDHFFQNLRSFHVLSFNTLSETQRMRELIAGPLIKDVITRIKESLYKLEENSKFYFYSGHDTSLHTLLRMLGFELNFVPYYGASVIFEVYNLSSNNHCIKVWKEVSAEDMLLYSKDYALKDVETMIIPGCEELCPLGKLIQRFERILEQNWEAECNDG